MTDSGLTYLLWSDLVGVTRTRGVPTRDLERRRAAGLGWACAGQALTPFEAIVDNPWGPMDEARQVPDMASRFTIPARDEWPAVDAVICSSMRAPGIPWECCARTFYARALEDLEAETGLGFMASFEHEFSVEAPGFEPETPFSFAAARALQPFLLELEAMLTAAGVGVETVEPEYGLGQYEVSCAPAPGMRAGDVALITRETIREVARRCGLRASFSPKPFPDAVGNGAHIHMSLVDGDGRNMSYERDGPMGLGPTAAHFAAGILAHVDALVAFTAPSPVSYHRLGPHHWSCGFRAIGLQNREATLRVVPGSGPDEESLRRGHNIEYRPADGVASPYLALGVLVRAGLEGIRRKMALPPAATTDPAEMSEAGRREAGITPLPASLDAALAALEKDAVAGGWFAEPMLSTYVALKRWEVSFASSADEADLFARYRTAY